LNKQKLLERIEGNSKNISYSDFVALIEAFGFKRTRGKGSHEIYRRENVSSIINIQNSKGKAKPYQVEQFLEVIKKFNLRLEGNNE